MQLNPNAMPTSWGAVLVLVCAAAADQHAAVASTIIEAMNDFASAPAQLLGLFDDDADDAAWCDPYPQGCARGKANISSFLHSMPAGTDTAMLAEPLVSVGSVGGMMTTLSFSWPGSHPACLYTADNYVSWNITGNAQPKVNYVRWVYNATEFDEAIGICLGQSAVHTVVQEAVASASGSASREPELQAVRDYVVGLQHSLAQEALICDLLTPTARYCDPYPTSCAYGRAGCRAMKGLPNDTSTMETRAGAASPSRQYQCRPGSVRPLMPTGPATGAVYLAYSSASRDQATGKLSSHKLHHTWAMWDLAPVGTTQRAPAPMLASFDWFMPDHNV